MYGYGLGYYGLDWTVLLLFAGMILSLAVSARMKSTFAKYSRIPSASQMT